MKFELEHVIFFIQEHSHISIVDLMRGYKRVGSSYGMLVAARNDKFKSIPLKAFKVV
jgi:hypothetical protein